MDLINRIDLILERMETEEEFEEYMFEFISELGTHSFDLYSIKESIEIGEIDENDFVYHSECY